MDFLKNLNHDDISNREIWILGDFNIDCLKRDNPDTIKVMSLCKILVSIH